MEGLLQVRAVLAVLFSFVETILSPPKLGSTTTLLSRRAQYTYKVYPGDTPATAGLGTGNYARVREAWRRPTDASHCHAHNPAQQLTPTALNTGVSVLQLRTTGTR